MNQPTFQANPANEPKAKIDIKAEIKKALLAKKQTLYKPALPESGNYFVQQKVKSHLIPKILNYDHNTISESEHQTEAG